MQTQPQLAQTIYEAARETASLLDSISNATQTLNAANNGLTSLTKLVQSAQAIAQQALQSASTTAKVTGSVSGQTAATVTGIITGKTITVSDGTTTVTYTAAAADDLQDLMDVVNNSAPLKINASLTSSGALKFEAEDASTITITSDANVTELDAIGVTAAATTGALNATRTSLGTQFDDIRSQISQLAADSGYNGVNLLNGDSLSVVFNETGTSTQSISGVTFDAAGLGVSAAANAFQTDTDVNAALSDLTSALSTLRSQSVAFGSSLSVVQTRQDFTKSMVNTLQTGADNLVLADTNLEGANMLALQTRQSLSTTALSLAAQASQSVLRLFG